MIVKEGRETLSKSRKYLVHNINSSKVLKVYLGSYEALFSKCLTKARAVTTSKFAVIKLNIPVKVLNVAGMSMLFTRLVNVLKSRILSSASTVSSGTPPPSSSVWFV